MTCVILERTSGLKSSSETTAPMYFKLDTSPGVLSFYLGLPLDAAIGQVV